jgi:PadR family transcriptional regulator, regulatory protein PadR
VNDGTLEIFSGWIEPFLLLGLWERDSYERELARKIDHMGFEVASPQEVHRSLRRMEEEGMVVSEHEGSDGRPLRRRYEITESGPEYLEFWVNSLAWYQEEVDLFLRTYADGSAW